VNKVIVFDVMGVIFEVGDDTNDLLVPYIQKLNQLISRELINEIYIEASLGRISSKDFWHKTGFKTDYEEIERFYLETRIKIDKEFIEVAEKLGRNYDLAVLSNDVSEWGKCLRSKYGLDRLFKEIVISGDVGYRKPDARIYDILLKRLGVMPENCIFIDDRYKNLQVASQKGFKTIRFNRDLLAKSFEPDLEISSFRELKELILDLKLL
jgi:putative hydrolase of the HAD superfamily